MNATELDKLCRKLKGTTTDVKWGNDLCYCVGGKMYCVITLEGSPKVCVKVLPEEFTELTERKNIIPAPYVAKYHWVMVENFAALKPDEWKKYVQQSYQLVFDKLPKKVRESISSRQKL